MKLPWISYLNNNRMMWRGGS